MNERRKERKENQQNIKIMKEKQLNVIEIKKIEKSITKAKTKRKKNRKEGKKEERCILERRKKVDKQNVDITD